MLIISTFNNVFWGSFIIFLLILASASILLKNKPAKTKEMTLIISMVITFILFWVYKYGISIDEEYALLRQQAGYGEGTFTWFDELPLQLCNINMMLIPLAIITKKRPLLSFCFLIAPLGALMALLMPGIGFSGYSILAPRMAGFYFTHFMIFIAGIALYTFNIYRPEYKDIIPCVIQVFIVNTAVFAINMLLRVTSLNLHANYFFNVETEGNPILDIFYNLIPVPYLYQLPLYLVLVILMVIETSVSKLISRNKAV